MRRLDLGERKSNEEVNHVIFKKQKDRNKLQCDEPYPWRGRIDASTCTGKKMILSEKQVLRKKLAFPQPFAFSGDCFTSDLYPEIEYLGYQISTKGLVETDEKIEAILNIASAY